MSRMYLLSIPLPMLDLSTVSVEVRKIKVSLHVILNI